MPLFTPQVGRFVKNYGGRLSVAGFALFGALLWAAQQKPTVSQARSFAQVAVNLKVVDNVYRGGLLGAWQDWGWAPRELGNGKPAKINFSNYGGWSLFSDKIPSSTAALRFRMRAPATHNNFIEIQLRNSETGDRFAAQLSGAETVDKNDGWKEITLSLSLLNPKNLPFNQVVFRAFRQVGQDWVEIDDIELLGSNAPAQTIDAASLAKAQLKRADVQIHCDRPGHSIDPMIYGIAYSARTDHEDSYLWQLRPAARRWGGNPTSRYNWKLGNAWNTAADWYFTNVNYTDNPNFHWSQFLEDNRRRGVQTALTVPILGWVAKDTTSSSFPVSIFGAQQSVFPGRSGGNGVRRNGETIKPGAPSQTSVPMPPEEIEAWVRDIRARDQKAGGRSVHLYYLDNEPMLWHITHRDVHPEPVTYDELLERTIAYGSAIRRADPEAVIAGPALWGWPAYFYSAADKEAGFILRPDRRKHGDVPLLEWYLRQLRDYEKKTGVRILDVVDVHYYPQAKDIYRNGGLGAANPESAALRLRSTRSLWDKAYFDESWINDSVQLLPRLQKMIDDNYPGRRISIGEYNFGGEQHISGALALAETLGRFGQFPTMAAAYYWTYPKEGSPAYHAFRAYRDYDGAGARFLDTSVPTSAPEPLSLFASRDGSNKKVVAIVVNRSADDPLRTFVDISACGVGGARGFEMHEGSTRLNAMSNLSVDQGKLEVVLPAYSMAVLEFK